MEYICGQELVNSSFLSDMNLDQVLIVQSESVRSDQPLTFADHWNELKGENYER